jgi:hypothetical protein
VQNEFIDGETGRFIFMEAEFMEAEFMEAEFMGSVFVGSGVVR